MKPPRIAVSRQNRSQVSSFTGIPIRPLRGHLPRDRGEENCGGRASPLDAAVPVPEQDPQVRRADHPVAGEIADRRVRDAPEG